MAGIMDGERQFHIQTTPEEVGKYVILPGDPGRVPKLRRSLKTRGRSHKNREYNVYTGTLMALLFPLCRPESAARRQRLRSRSWCCGAHTFIRVGTSGGIDTKVHGGDLILASAACAATAQVKNICRWTTLL